MHPLAGTRKLRISAIDGVWLFEEIELTTSNTWQANAAFPLLGLSFGVSNGAYNPADGRVYFWNANIHAVTSFAAAVNNTLTTNFNPADNDTTIGKFFSDGTRVFCTFRGFLDRREYLLWFSSNSVRNESDAVYGEVFCSTSVGMGGTGHDGNAYGITDMGRIFSFGTRLHLWIEVAQFQGWKVSDLINELLSKFLLLGSISPTKKAYIARRSDENGNPFTTGNTLSITVNSASNVQLVRRYSTAIQLARVSNGNNAYTFNGTAYNTDLLSDGVVLEVESEFIPDNLLQDLAFYAYQYFSKNRNLYRTPLGNIPRFEFEPFDAAQISFSNTNIQATASGPIVSIEYGKDGTMTIETLVEES
jgi:hypothetical protein